MDKRIYQSAPPIIRNFLIYLETIRGKSSKTVNEYYIDLRTFFRFIKQFKGLVPKDTVFEKIEISDVDAPLASSISLSDIYEYIYYLTRVRNNQPSTRSRKIASLRSFYKYLCDKAGVVKQNPTSDLESPKKKKALPKYMTLEESMKFLSDIGGEYKERDYCMMTLFLNCGLRLSELVGLSISDIQDDTMRVTGKGNKERTVYLNKACIDAINSYLAVRPHDGVKDRDALFLSRRKKRISPKTVQYTVKKNLKLSGLSGRGLSTHKLRHTAATLMYQHGGVDIRVLKEILGHENLSTTEIYTHTSSVQLKKAIASSPLANFEVKKENVKK